MEALPVSDVVICEPVRTPVGSFRGVFAGVSAVELATSALVSLLQRTGLGEGDVDDRAVSES
jgi:acetyl-CoA C-acetyltransferase